LDSTLCHDTRNAGLPLQLSHQYSSGKRYLRRTMSPRGSLRGRPDVTWHVDRRTATRSKCTGLGALTQLGHPTCGNGHPFPSKGPFDGTVRVWVVSGAMHSNPPVSGHGAGYLDVALPIAITRNGHVYDEADSCLEAERGFRLGESLDQEEATWFRWSTRSPDALYHCKFIFPPEEAYRESVDVGECRERQVAESSRGHALPALEPPNGVEGDRRSLGEGGNQVVMAHGWPSTRKSRGTLCSCPSAFPLLPPGSSSLLVDGWCRN
jgi:hypothetical protein